MGGGLPRRSGGQEARALAAREARPAPWGTEHSALSTSHRAPSTEHQAPSTAHRASTDLFLLNARGLYQQVIGLVKRHPLLRRDQRRHAGEPRPCPATASPGPAESRKERKDHTKLPQPEHRPVSRGTRSPPFQTRGYHCHRQTTKRGGLSWSGGPHSRLSLCLAVPDSSQLGPSAAPASHPVSGHDRDVRCTGVLWGRGVPREQAGHRMGPRESPEGQGDDSGEGPQWGQQDPGPQAHPSPGGPCSQQPSGRGPELPGVLPETPVWMEAWRGAVRALRGPAQPGSRGL